MSRRDKRRIRIGDETYSKGELAQIVRRKKMSKTYKDKTKYSRKNKWEDDDLNEE